MTLHGNNAGVDVECVVCVGYVNYFGVWRSTGSGRMAAPDSLFCLQNFEGYQASFKVYYQILSGLFVVFQF